MGFSYSQEDNFPKSKPSTELLVICTFNHISDLGVVPS